MARLRTLIVLALVVLPLMTVAAQELPPPPLVALALDSLSITVGQPLTVADLDSWSYEQDVYTDTALGCAFAAGTPRPEGVSAYTFNLVYQGISYDYRVAADASIVFRCDQSLQVPPPTPVTNGCPAGFSGFLPPRLEVGGRGRIGTEGVANRLREAPSINAEQIGVINPGTTVAILDGPSCEAESGIIWWRVDSNGIVGWTAEGELPDNYFLAPIGSALLAERSLITAENADTLVPLATLPLQGVRSISFTSDGTLVAFGGLRGLSVYTMSTFELNSDISDPGAPVSAVAFSPDGRYLAYSTNSGLLFVYDTLLSARTQIARPPDGAINDLAFSGDDRYVLAVGSGTPADAPDVPAWTIYDLPDVESLVEFNTDSWVRGVAFSHDDSLFAWLDTALQVTATADNQTALTLALQAAPISGLAWRPPAADGEPQHQVAFSDGTLVRLVDIETEVEQMYFADDSFFPGAISFSRDGSLLAAMNRPPEGAVITSTVNIFDTFTGDLITSTPVEPSESMVFSPDGTLLVIGSQDEVIFLGVDTGLLAVG